MIQQILIGITLAFAFMGVMYYIWATKSNNKIK